ncbi:MAG: hypothetical protein Phog2KO_22830 [Phototrophicaceae bacterium]
MARHGGGHGGYGRPRGHGRHGGPRGYRRYGGRIPHPFPMFGYFGRLGCGLFIVPFMGIFFMMMLINVSTHFTTILGVLCVVAAFALLYQARSKEKNKRKNDTYDYEDDDFFCDNEFDDGQII